MFDVVPLVDMEVTELYLNMRVVTVTMNVYTKVGTYVGSELTVGDWTLVDSKTITGAGRDLNTIYTLPSPVALTANQAQGFYITEAVGIIFNHNSFASSGTLGTLATSNSDLQIYYGIASTPLFGFYEEGFAFVGSFVYRPIA